MDEAAAGHRHPKGGVPRPGRYMVVEFLRKPFTEELFHLCDGSRLSTEPAEGGVQIREIDLDPAGDRGPRSHATTGCGAVIAGVVIGSDEVDRPRINVAFTTSRVSIAISRSAIF